MRSDERIQILVVLKDKNAHSLVFVLVTPDRIVAYKLREIIRLYKHPILGSVPTFLKERKEPLGLNVSINKSPHESHRHQGRIAAGGIAGSRMDLLVLVTHQEK